MKNYIKNNQIKDWLKKIFPFPRSLTGYGNDLTIDFIKKNINRKFKIKTVPSLKKIYDWKIPLTWLVKDAYIIYKKKKILDYSVNNLHLVGYSTPQNFSTTINKIKKHLFFLKNKPSLIPFVTSYYKKFWGFCISYNQYKKLDKKAKIKIVIKSKLIKSKMKYLEYKILGKSKKEILIVSYICHPSMANNELSGLIVASALSKLLKASKYTVRIILIPETIGAINFISIHKKHLDKNLIAGFNLSCVGFGKNFSLIMSKEENTYADKVALRNLAKYGKFKKYSFLDRGSNERQFGCQNLNYPFVTITRKKFENYKEYHTSGDNLDLIKVSNIKKTLSLMTKIIGDIQSNKIYTKKMNCEPFLSKYNLIDTTSHTGVFKKNSRKIIQNFIAYADKNYDLYEISKKLKTNKSQIINISKKLKSKKIIQEYI